MTATAQGRATREAGIGLIEILVGIVISMLLVLMIYQVYEISEGQKRTITSASDAQWGRKSCIQDLIQWRGIQKGRCR